MRTPDAHHAAQVRPEKLRAPVCTATLIDRPTLIQQFQNALSGKLVLLLAPTGSGKTTLLNQWFAQAGAGGPVAWLLCEDGDNEPARFFACLAAAVEQAVRGLDSDMCDGAGGPRERIEDLADALLERLRRVRQSLIIAIDDFHWIHDADINRVFSALLLRSPHQVHWVIASRRVPGFELGRLKLEEQLTVLGSTELGFQPGQVGELAQRLRGLRPSAHACAELCRRTEGWVAGIKLAVLSAADASECAMRSSSGLDHDTATYLARAVLDSQLPAIREFLLASSILEHVCAELCDALPGIADATSVLDELQRSQLFIQPLDTQRRWFRYHTIFLEFLRGTLRRTAPGRIQGLHQAASLWYADHARPADALHHAFATEDQTFRLTLLARCVPGWLHAGEFTAVLQWTTRLSVDEIVRSQIICTAHLMSLIFSRQFDAARCVLHAAHAIAVDEERERALEIHRVLLAIMEDHTAELTMPHIERLSTACDPYLTAAFLTVCAYCMLVHRRFEAARRLALRGSELLRGTSDTYFAAQSEIVLVLVDRAEGHARAANEGCVQVYARVKDARRTPIWVTATTALASLHYHHNELEQAQTLCTEVLPLVSIAPSVESLMVAHIVAARLKIAADERREALRLLDHLHGMLDSYGCRRLLAQLCFEKVRLWLLEGECARAAATLSELGAPRLDTIVCDNGELDETREQLALARIAILIHRGKFDAAAGMLARLQRRAAATGYIYGQIRLQAALATCHWFAHDEDSAFNALDNALQLTHHRGFSRTVFDEVTGLALVFSTAVRRSRLATLPPPDYFKKFQDLLTCDLQAKATAGSLPMATHPLTQRELDLLQLLSLGLSNRDISARCNITLFTTKWHLKNVFAKLGVGTRTEALFRAHQLKLLETYVSPRGPAPHARARMGAGESTSRRGGNAGAGARRNARKGDFLARDEGESAE